MNLKLHGVFIANVGTFKTTILKRTCWNIQVQEFQSETIFDKKYWQKLASPLVGLEAMDLKIQAGYGNDYNYIPFPFQIT